MNMISKVAPSTAKLNALRVEVRRPSAAGNAPRSSATPLVVLAAAVTLWNSDPSPAAAPPLPR